MTYHPRGDQTSVTWFDGADWIGFHMLQGGHCLRYDTRAEPVARGAVVQSGGLALRPRPR